MADTGLIEAAGLGSRDLLLLQRRGLNEAEIGAFAELLEQARDWSAAERRTRLDAMDASQRDMLRKGACLADPIATAGLSLEGVFNLFQAPTAARDLDGDGFQSVGAALSWTFPPPGAPEALKRAWGESVEGLSEGEVMLRQGLFLPHPQRASTGALVWPGEPGWTDPCENEGFSWQGFVRARQEANELAGTQNPGYAWARDFYGTFLAALERNGVA